jgi:hypothetical protein
VLKKLPAIATSALIAAGLVAGPTAGAATADTTVPSRSGLGWASGVFIPGDSAAAVESFGTWRGAKTDVAVTWPARSNWNDVVNPTWLYDRWKSAPQTLVLGVPPFPENVGGSLDACANGAYDAQWRQFGTTIKNNGMSDRTIVRLGWEFNGNWYAWSARNPSQFAACWRKVHSAAESTAPNLRWDWNVNRGPSQLNIDSRDAYPGDAYVDIVGVDSYDGWPGAVNEATWSEHYNGAFGLKFWSDFARQHGKKLSIPEWGVYPGTAWAGHNGGDNPFYIAKMFGFFKEQKDNLAYEAYFNEPHAYYAGALNLNPKAAAEYLKQTGIAVQAAKSTATPAPTTPAPTTPAPTATTTPSTAPTTAPPAPTVTVTAPAATVTQTVTAPAAPPVTVTTAAAPTVTVTAPAAPRVTVTVTAPAAPAVTVTAPAAPAVTVTVPAAPPVTVTAPAAPPVTVTAPAVTVTTAPTAAAPTASATTITKPTVKPKKPSVKKPATKPTVKPKKPKAKKPKPQILTLWKIVKIVQKANAASR